MYYNKVKASLPNWTEAKIVEETKRFVSYPSYDLCNPSVHNTGGAIDLTLCDKHTGEEFDMGTAFDDFTSKANTARFETLTDKTVRENRRLLYWAMLKSGFTSLPSEWWHYDFGDNFWSFYTGKPAMYQGMG